nr:sterol carrier protein domain-containing protein [Nocardia gipuzkoensis]
MTVVVHGIASAFARVEVQRRRARLRETVAAAGSVRFVDGVAAWKLLPQIYATADISWTGAVDRPEYWWRLQELLSTAPSYCLVHGPAGAEDGFARHQPVDPASWLSRPEEQQPAAAPAHRRACGAGGVDSGRDLVAPGRCHTSAGAAGLSGGGRGRGGGGRSAAGRELRPIPHRGRRCATSAETAEVTVGVADLAAVYLGGTTWRALAFAGRVDEHRPGAVAAADALFATDGWPFSGTFF